MFVQKRNENSKVVIYKACFVAQGFLQRPGVNFDKTYSPVVDAITFQYLRSLAVYEKVDMHLIDVVTAYLYGNLENDISMKVPKRFNMHVVYSGSLREYSIKL